MKQASTIATTTTSSSSSKPLNLNRGSVYIEKSVAEAFQLKPFRKVVLRRLDKGSGGHIWVEQKRGS